MAPEAHLRGTFPFAIDTQDPRRRSGRKTSRSSDAANRWLPNSETGERVLKEVPVRFLPWWWQDEAGKLMFTLRYGKRIELKPGKPAIVGELAHLVPTLKLVRAAVAAGELDTAEEQRRQR